LSGVIVAGVAAFSFGAPVIFFAIAAAMAVLLGSLRVIDIHQNRKIARRDGFLNNIDVRIEFLERNISLVKGLVQKFSSSKPASGEEPDEVAEVLNNNINEQKQSLVVERSHSTPASSTAKSKPVYSGSDEDLAITVNKSVDEQPTVRHEVESVPVAPAVTLPQIHLEFVRVTDNKATMYAVQRTCGQEEKAINTLESANFNTSPAA
jgi:hypothetical protein